MPIELTIADFDKQPRGPYAFDFWLSKRTIPSPMGEFDAELREEPTEELVRHVNEMAAFVAERSDDILKLVHVSYLRVTDDEQWMQACEVPQDLDRDQVIPYLDSRSIVVELRRGRIEKVFHINPQWDEEHKIDLELKGGVLKFYEF